jgi:hypothetical protein
MQHYYFLPLTRVDVSILPPYFSTVVHKRSVDQLTGCLPIYLGLSQISTVVGFAGREVLAPAHIAQR